MGSALPKVDESAGWPKLPCCPHRHKVSVPCPPTGIWLVLVLCHRCDPGTEIYCAEHKATNWWLSTMSSSGRTRPEVVPELDIQQRRTGDAA